MKTISEVRRETEIKELLEFLRKENDASRTAVRQDSDANRKLLTDSLKVIAYPATAALAILSFLGFRSVTEMKSTIQTEAKAQTSAEVTRMQEEIRKRLGEQFQTPNLKAIVSEAARNATATTAQPLIKAEVNTQVGRSIEAQKGVIKQSVTDQTQQAVKQMGSTIDSYVKTAVDTKVASAVDPVAKQVRDLSNEANVQMSIMRMSADDATAFDALNYSPLNNLPQEQQVAIVGAFQKQIDQANGGGLIQSQTFTSPHSHDELIAALDSKSSLERDAALSGLEMQVDPNFMTRLIRISVSDSSLRVRAHAQRIFNNWTGAKTRILVTQEIADWWNKNGVEFMKAHPAGTPQASPSLKPSY
jgi:hypothetical protein